MGETHLTGLDGTNPLAFFAALGVQEVFSQDSEQPRLWWSDDVIPHAVVDGEFSIDRIANRALEVFSQWKNSYALNPIQPDGKNMKNAGTLKFVSTDIRAYIDQARQRDFDSGLATSLLAEGSLANNGLAKPSDLYFTSKNQKFTEMARKIFEGVSLDDIVVGLNGPWRYESKLPSLMWDVMDDRSYALRARNPEKDKKQTNPGPEALAVLGLSLHPVFAEHKRTLTQGCSGSWDSGSYSWPLWEKPSSPRVVRSLLAHGYTVDRTQWLRSWGIFKIMKSVILRDRGAGKFSPPQVIWEA